MSLAPIAFFVYNRPHHTKKTIESLKNNVLAKESDLFIFSDGPKNKSDEAKVNEVRDFIKTIVGFNKVYIKESKVNRGLANSIISGVSEVINEFSKIIVLEDDLVSASGFLKFMNEALDFYEDNLNIFSVSGYSFPISIPENYNKEVYILQRASTWGWGTWKNRFEKADWEVKNYKNFRSNKYEQKKFNLGGEDLTPMLKAQMNGLIDSWGIRWSYTHFKNNAYCLYPVNSKLVNIGTDSSGTHSRKTEKFDVILHKDFSGFNFDQELDVNSQIETSLKNFFKLSLQRRIINFLKFNFFVKK